MLASANFQQGFIYLLIMIHKKLLVVSFFLGLFLFVFSFSKLFSVTTTNGAPPYDPSNTDNVTQSEEQRLLKNWKRPESPAKVALQVGHLKNDDVPEELEKLKGNTGASGGGKSESEVNYAIAEKTKELLEAKGVRVELLPATIPPHYWADVFVAIHADGSEDTAMSGYKVATSRRDTTGTAHLLVADLESSYEKATGLTKDPNITRNMRGYYAFSWWRYEHAVHPMTASAIIETGFLTNPSDQELLIYKPEISAEGIANGIITYLASQHLLP